MSTTDKMPLTKIEAFFDEFDWLSEYVDTSAESIFVKRIDHELLQTVRNADPMYADHHMKPVLLLDENGKCVGKVGVVYTPRKTNYRWWKFWTWGYISVPRETVLQAIRRIGDKKPIHFVLSIEYVSHLPYSNDTLGSVTIYKVPNGFTAQTWITHQSQLARAVVKEECATIDAEGKT